MIAVLDLGLTRSQHADRVAPILARWLTAHGATDVVTATHPLALADRRRVAVAGGWSGLSGAAVVEVLDATAGAAGELLEPDPADEERSRWWDGQFSGPTPWREPVAAVAADHAARRAGRVVCFPGSAGLRGVVPVARIRRASAIEEVRVLAAGVAADAALVETRDFVRPRYTDGRLVLDTQPAAGGRLACFESPNPTRCCADHG